MKIIRNIKNLPRDLSFIPVLVLIFLIIFFVIPRPSAKVIEPPYLFPILNTVFISLVSLVVAYVAVKSYLTSGSSTILLLGAGVFAFGTGSFASGWTIDRWGVNVSATVHNAPLLLAAIFHMAGVIASARELSPEPEPARRRWKLFAAYISAPLFVFSVFLLSVNGIMPPFFIAGVGTTVLRQVVLAAAFVLFVYSSSYMMSRFLWKKERYLYWYSLALALLALMIICFYIQPAVGSPIGWVGRSAQYMAGIYFIVAVISAKREARMRGMTMNEAVAELFLAPGFHWQDILKTALNGFWIVDTRGRFLEVNEACCRILGYTRVELFSMTVADVEAVENPADVLHRIEVMRQQKSDHFVSRHRRKDGSIIDVEVNASYLDIGEGQIGVFIQDITRRKQAEDQLAKQAVQLQERTAQLEEAFQELESFSYSISHDLRAPLRTIDGFSRKLEREYGKKLGPEGERVIGVIRGSTEKMGVLIDDLLSFSRVQKTALTISAIDMDKLAGEICAEIRAANKAKKLDLKISEILPGYGDPTLIRQVLFNLFDNAVKFTRKRKPSIIEMSSYRDSGKVVYCLKDNGAGFDMAYYNKLFGVFQRLHSNEEYEGTGVGLAIVQRIINRHGGRVWAEGEIDKGATFYFTLPACTA